MRALAALCVRSRRCAASVGRAGPKRRLLVKAPAQRQSRRYVEKKPGLPARGARMSSCADPRRHRPKYCRNVAKKTQTPSSFCILRHGFSKIHYLNRAIISFQRVGMDTCTGPSIARLRRTLPLWALGEPRNSAPLQCQELATETNRAARAVHSRPTRTPKPQRGCPG